MLATSNWWWRSFDIGDILCMTSAKTVTNISKFSSIHFISHGPSARLNFILYEVRNANFFQDRTFLEFWLEFSVWEKFIFVQSDLIINLHVIRVSLLEFLIVSNSVFLYNSDAGRNGRSGTGWNVSNYLRKNWINFRNKPPHSKWFKFRVFNHFTTISRNSRKTFNSKEFSKLSKKLNHMIKGFPRNQQRFLKI